MSGRKACASGRKALALLTITTILSVLGAAAAAAKDRDDHGTERGGSVRPCSLEGVNSALHPEIFGNAATAQSFGFVQAVDRSWRVRPDCHR